LSPEDVDALVRWRLALGPGAEEASSALSLGTLGAAGAADLLDPGGEDAGTPENAESLSDLDDALSFVYGRPGEGPRKIHLPKWLGLVRRFFRDDVVALVQKDAIESKGLTRLLFEPETLPYLEKNVDLVATLLSARGLVPDEAKDTAREIVREVVAELRKKLETEARTAIYGAARRNLDSPLRIARNLDWKRTIRRNLKTWDAKRRRLVPERFHFWANQRKHHEWNVSILVDQSGSMAVSAVYSAVMAAIFASLDVLKTNLAFFNERVVVDMTPMLNDPVEVLFSAQLGGAEDLAKAIAFAEQHYITQPEKTILLLITDLFDTCGNVDDLVVRMRRLVESRVKVMVLLKLSDQGKPSYNHDLAKRLTAVGVACFGCTPRLLVGIVERVMKGEDFSNLVSEGVTGRMSR
jgi:Mg-chelatase subunit ChlD